VAGDCARQGGTQLVVGDPEDLALGGDPVLGRVDLLGGGIRAVAVLQRQPLDGGLVVSRALGQVGQDVHQVLGALVGDPAGEGTDQGRAELVDQAAAAAGGVAHGVEGAGGAVAGVDVDVDVCGHGPPPGASGQGRGPRRRETALRYSMPRSMSSIARAS
jgi:hypothetical protein